MFYLIAEAAETESNSLLTIILFIIALIPSFFAIRWMLKSGKGKKYDLRLLSQELAVPITPDMSDDEVQKKLEVKTKLVNSKLIQFLPFPLVFFFLFFISKEILSVLAVAVYKSLLPELDDSQITPAMEVSFRVAQYIIVTLTSLFIAFGGLFAVEELVKYPIFRAFFTGRERKFRDILEAMLILALSTILIYFVVNVMWTKILVGFGVELEEQLQIVYLRESKDVNLWLATTFAVVIGAPIFEEIIFRGFLYRTLRKYQSVMMAAVTQGFLFSILHMSLSVFLPLWVLGIVLALMAEKFQSLLPSIIAHAIFNGFTIVMLLLGPVNTWF